MKVFIQDLDELKRIIRRRWRSGPDRFDEVWDGGYVMSSIANNELHKIILHLAMAITLGFNNPEIRVFPGCKISDCGDDWTRNDRCPDIAVFLPENPAEDRRSHRLGGPDFAVEMISPGDRARRKLDFYARVGVRELLLIDRRPWSLELYRPDDGQRRHVGTCIRGETVPVRSTVLGLDVRLTDVGAQPSVEIVRPADGWTWPA